MGWPVFVGVFMFCILCTSAGETFDGTNERRTAAATEAAEASVLARNPPFQVSKRACYGLMEEDSRCVENPKCVDCVPLDCRLSDWSSWAPMQPCIGLCSRNRRILTYHNVCGKQCNETLQQTKQCLNAIEWMICSNKPVNCTLGAWSEWSKCVTGVVGQSFRERKATNPQHGGVPCESHTKETRPCPRTVPVSCEFDPWSAWSACSLSCGAGRHSRTRKIGRFAAGAGKLCNGSIWENSLCNAKPCPPFHDCMLGNWSMWQGCDAQQSSQRFRQRSVVQKVSGGGSPCNWSSVRETSDCEDTATPTNCTLSEWEEWSSCSAKCGGGQTQRMRHVVVSARNCGACPDTTTKETKACNTGSCVLPDPKHDCTFGSWGAWSSCSSLCGVGTMSRERNVSKLAGLGGRPCVGALKALFSCKGTSADCDVVTDCKWGQWDGWSVCSKSCGGGSAQRGRIVEVAPAAGGKACPAKNKTEVSSCNTQSCKLACIDGTWGEWSVWSPCSASCDAGYRQRQRGTNTLPSACGKPATGIDTEFAACPTMKPCTAPADCVFTDWSSWSVCSASCFGVRDRSRSIKIYPAAGGKLCNLSSLEDIEPCSRSANEASSSACKSKAQNCHLSAWSSWSMCPVKCGGSQTTRARSVELNARYGGILCTGPLAETKACVTTPCERKCTDCTWGAWSDWSRCSKCGDQMTRTRPIEQVGNYCGKPCVLTSAQQVSSCQSNCTTQRWCTWTAWSVQSTCSGNCEKTQERKRSLNAVTSRPESSLFTSMLEQECHGAQLDVNTCNISLASCHQACIPRNCVWGDWTDWMSPRCNEIASRVRTMKKRNNLCGEPCEGADAETKRIRSNCSSAVDCALSEWVPWSSCTSTGGQSYRTRSISTFPANEGRPCRGNLRETRSCKKEAGRVDCAVSAWSRWSACTKSCDGGYQKRTREIETRSSGNGFACTEALEEIQSCSEECCPKVDCVLTDWGDWGSCKSGQRNRLREIQLEPIGNGKPCMGVLEETGPCTAESHECSMSEWKAVSVCTKSCGGGQITQIRAAEHRTSDCPTDVMRVLPCMTQSCDAEENCKLSDWADWGSCSSSCGAGQRSRSRSVLNMPTGAGLGCDANLTVMEECSLLPCYFVDCEWEDWAEWGNCSRTCDGGQMQRLRKILHVATPGGKPCDAGDSVEVAGCANTSCAEVNGPKICVDAKWGIWTEWNDCSSSCNGGLQTRQRNVSQEANECGQTISGVSQELRDCNQKVSCVKSEDCRFMEWSEWTACVAFNTAVCDGNMTRFRNWSERSGEGQHCVGAVADQKGCTLPEDLSLGRVCHTSDKVMDCEMTQWSTWTDCSRPCEFTQSFRSRTIAVEPRNGGKVCSGHFEETQSCKRKSSCTPVHHIVDCSWGPWESWSACTSCTSQISRSRSVSSAPLFGGRGCGVSVPTQQIGNCSSMCSDKNEGDNLEWCTWQDWEDWGPCSRTCGEGGNMVRYRRYMVVPPESIPKQLFDVHALKEGLLELRGGVEDAESSRVQNVAVAFGFGMFSSVVLFFVVRGIGRWGPRFVSDRSDVENLPSPSGVEHIFTRDELLGDSGPRIELGTIHGGDTQPLLLRDPRAADGVEEDVPSPRSA
eukprot:TRINITY_DN17114_c0_g1_i1.p1 TRINITY_DN17114_c0_g1~~TRINITY_DN17114_c0_g1_i1.p1  ORF type:complete len:1608 (+),score=202.77 TRINITY_DN17114_c0_g1_i1:84-4907(+)